jgi:hypothetical protein
MDHATVRAALPVLVAKCLPANVRRLKFSIFDGQPLKSAMGFYVYPHPCEGTVIAVTASMIVIRTGRAQFTVIDPQLASQQPDVGARVKVTPYARRHFDGTRIDTPTPKIRQTSDGHPYTVQCFTLGGAITHLPVPPPRCAQLADLIEQLEKLPTPDGFRRISHLLVDAGAKDFTCVDPNDADIIRTPPAIRFTVSTAKFEGQVTVLYERGSDSYAIELNRDGELINRIDDVYAPELGHALESLIDDGSWRQIKIETISLARKPLPQCRTEMGSSAAHTAVHD